MKHLPEILTDAALIVLPADILYLYIAGGWTEPNLIILWSELIALPLLSLLGIWRTYKLIRSVI